MIEDLKTVEGEVISSDPIRNRQLEGVQQMRTSLLSCTDDNFNVAQTLQHITVLRIYHQLTRLVRYTEMIDKIEDKMYQSMDSALDQINPSNSGAWATLMAMQTQLQENMIASQKLIQPYLDMIKNANTFVSQADEIEYSGEHILDQQSRERLRSAAQVVLASLPYIVEAGETVDHH